MAADVDVLIVGAGLSGIGAACRLREKVPDATYAIVEARDAIGGTWDLFRYPGVRSDSDMYTLGYPFRPWKDPKSIADGPSILAYIRDTAAHYGVDRQIRFGHRVTRASWDTDTATWTVDFDNGATMTAGFVYMCAGYYSYEGGHRVDFPGRASFAGEVVHPQEWPADLDYTGKDVVIIGSGATAVTLLPAMAERAARVTMLQRSPSWVVAMPGRDPIANGLRKVLPERLAHRLVRGKNVVFGTLFYQACRRWPAKMGAFLRKGVQKQGVPDDPHFAPRYGPWDQRLCLAPDADIFKALRSGKAAVVTDEIDTFTPHGVRTASGTEIPADIVVTATGLKLVAFSSVEVLVDGEPVAPPEHLVYKGMMLSDVPNIAWCVGYTNASWTLRADLTSLYVTRLLRHMRRHGYTVCRPHLAPDDRALAHTRPAVDLSSGYVRRAAAALPRQGATKPWYVRQNYLLDLASTRLGRVADGTMAFDRRKEPARASV